MGLFGLFKKKSDETKVGNVEDFISLTRVYFQSVIATEPWYHKYPLPAGCSQLQTFIQDTYAKRQVRIGRKVSFAQNVDAGLWIE